jgi:hypothetical protein
MKRFIIWLCLFISGFIPAVSFAQDNSQEIEKIEKKVTSKLNSYYMTHGAVGIPSNAQPENVDIDIDSTKPVEGWTRRYETIGTATVTTAEVDAPNYACHFDVVAEIDNDGVVQILSLDSHRADNAGN